MPGKNIDPVKTGKFIAGLRKNLGLTQDQLGEKLFITRKSVSKWETGRCCPSIDMIKKLSEVLDVSIEELLAGEFLEKSDEVVEEVEEPTTFVTKNFHSKVMVISNIVLCIFVLVIIIFFFVLNLSADKVYLINYEDTNFTITNGIIVLSENGSYINIGDLYSDLDDFNSVDSYELTLYYEDDDGNKIIFAHFNGSNNFDFGKDDYKQIKELLKKMDNKWYLKVSNFINDNAYNLNLVITEKPKNEKVDSYLSNVEAKYSVDEFDSIDVSFIFEMDEEKIGKIFVNKKINVRGEIFNINYDRNSSYLKISSNKLSIVFLLNSKRITFNDINDNVFTVAVDTNNYINGENLTVEYMDLLGEILVKIRHLIQ